MKLISKYKKFINIYSKRNRILIKCVQFADYIGHVMYIILV